MLCDCDQKEFSRRALSGRFLSRAMSFFRRAGLTSFVALIFAVLFYSGSALAAGDSCTDIQNLSAGYGPHTYSDTTVGYTYNGLTGSGNTTAPDRIFRIDVPAGKTLTIGHSTTSFDSISRIATGTSCTNGAAAGTNIAAPDTLSPAQQYTTYHDDPNTQTFTYTNGGAVTKSILWVTGGYSTASGTFTLAWRLIDSTAPVINSFSYTNGYNTTTTQSITFSASDPESGIATQTITQLTAPLSAGTCGSYTTGSPVTVTSSPYTATVASGNCYKYNYTATNGDGGSTTSTGTSVTKVDTTAATAAVFSSGITDGYTALTSQSPVWSAGSDSESGLYGSSSSYWIYVTANTAGNNELTSGDGITAGTCGTMGSTSNVLTTDSTTFTHNSSTGTVPLTDARCYRYTVYTRNAAGLWSSNTSAATTKVDQTGPSVPVMSYTNGYNNTGSQSVSFTGYDYQSGLNYKYLAYKSSTLTPSGTQGVAPTCGALGGSVMSIGQTTSPYTHNMSSGNCYAYMAYAQNRVGTNSSWSELYPTALTMVDTSAPVVSANNSSSSWRNANVTITLSSSDTGGSGLNYSKYQWDGSDAGCRVSGTMFTNGNTITIPSTGSHTLYLCNADFAGNTGSWNGQYKLDTTAPTSLSISYTNGYLTTSPNNVSWSASDPESGIANYQVDAYSSTLSSSNGLAAPTCGTFSWLGNLYNLGTATSAPHVMTLGTCYQYQLYATNGAGTVSNLYGSSTTRFDGTAPTAPSSVTYTDGWTTSTSQSISWTAPSDYESGISSEQLYYDSAPLSNGTCGSWTGGWSTVPGGTNRAGSSHTMTSGYCYKYAVLVSNYAGLGAWNVSSTAITKVDSSAPAVPTLTYTNGYNNTGTQDVGISSTDAESGIYRYYLGFKQVAMTPGNGTDPTCAALGGSISGIGYVTTPPYTHTMSSGYCYAYMAVAYNNAGGSTAWSDQYPTALTKVDTSAPTPVSLSYFNGYIGSPSVLLTGSATDAQSGIHYYLFYKKETTLSNNQCNDSTWTGGEWLVTNTAPSNTYTYGVSSGKCYKFYLRADNYTGLGSYTSFTPTETVKYDATAPSAPTGITYTNGYVTGANVPVSWTASTDAESGISYYVLKYKEATLSAGSCSGWSSNWIDYSGVGGTSTTFPVTNGKCYKFTVTAYNNANLTTDGDLSPTAVTMADQSGPTGASIVINSGATYTNSYVSYSLDLNATDAGSGVSYMSFSCDNSNWSPDESWNIWKSFQPDLYASGNCTIADGTKTVYVRFKDNAGNYGASANDSIIQDTTAPTGTIVINGGATYTSNPVVTLTLSASDATTSVSQMRFSCNGSDYSSAEAYSTSKSFNLTNQAGTGCAAGDGLRAIRVIYSDLLGNWMSPGVQSSITLDTTSPTVSANNSSSAWYSSTPTITLSTSDNMGLSYSKYIWNGSDATCRSGGTSFTNGNTITMTVGANGVINGVNTLYLCNQDNVGQQGSWNGTYKLDTTAPSAPTTGYTNGYYTNTTIRLTPSATDGESGIYYYDIYRIQGDLSNNTCSNWGVAGYVTSITPATGYYDYTATNSKCYKFYSVAYNNAGLYTSGDTNPTSIAKVDTTPPSAPTNITYTDGYINTATVRVSWDASTDSESGIGYYEVNYKTGDLTSGTCLNWTGWSSYIGTSGVYYDVPVNSDTCYQFYIRAYNNSYQNTAGNMSPTAVTKVDRGAPDFPGIVINGAAAYTNSSIFSLDLTVEDLISGISQVRFSCDNSNWSIAESYVAVWTFDLSAYAAGGCTTTDGVKTVYVKYSDSAGNWSAAANDNITLDSQAPSGTVSINAGATYTTSAAVTLTLSASDVTTSVDYMRFSCDNATWTSQEAYATSRSFNLIGESGAGCSAGDGVKTVYVKYRDVAVNWMSSAASDTITLDSTNPTVSATGASATWYNASTQPTITLSTSDNVGLSYSKYIWDGSDATCRSSGTTFINGNTTSIVSTGTHVLYLCNEDTTAHQGSWNGTYKLDSAGPTGSISINSGDVNTSNPAVTLTLSATDDFSGVTQMQFSCNNVSWTTAEAYGVSKSFNITNQSGAGCLASEGTKYVYVKYIDVAGNSATYSDTIEYDISAPTGGSFYIWGTAPDGDSNFTNSTTGNYLIVTCPTDGWAPIQMAYGNSASPTNWTTCSESVSNYALLSGEGTKTVYMRFRDNGGNTTSDITANIVLDQTGPTGATFVINNGATYTNQQWVDNTLNITCPTDAAGWTPILMAWDLLPNPSGWDLCSTLVGNYNLGSGDGMKTVYVRFTDAGHNTPLQLSDTIILDTQVPTGSILINADAAATNNSNVTLTLSASDTSSGMSQMKFSCNNANWSTEEAYATSKSFNLAGDAGIGCTSLEGTRVVYVKFKDVAGNWANAVTDGIMFDTQGATATVSIDNNFYSASSFVDASTIHGTASDTTSTVATVQLTIQESGTGNYWTGGGWGVQTWLTATGTDSWTYSIPHTQLTSGRTYTVIARATDIANNTGSTSTDSFVYDTTAPAGGAVSINAGAGYSNSQTGNTLNITCPTDAANWTPVEMAYGNSASPANWTTCAASVTSYDLGSGEGTKTVYTRFRDAGGNTTSDVTDTIVLDTVKPTTTVVIDGTLYSPNTFTPDTDIIHGTAADSGSGVASVEITIYNGTNYWTGSTWGAQTWLPVTTGTTSWKYTMHTTDLANGLTYTVTARATDAASNTTTAGFGTDTFAYDSSAPTAPSAVSFTAVGGTVLTNTLNSTNTNFTASATIVAGQATGGTAELLKDGVPFSTPIRDTSIAAGDTTVTFDPGLTNNSQVQAAFASGAVVSVKLTDSAGNYSISTVNPTITVDYSVPTAPSSVTFTAIGGTVVTNTLNSTNSNFTATATIVAGQATGGTAELLKGGSSFSTPIVDSTINSGDTTVDFSGGFTFNAQVRAAFASGATVSVKITDAAGNTITSSVNPTIIVDYIPPTASSVIIGQGANYTSSASVVLALSSTDSGTGLSQMKFSCNQTSWTTAETYAVSRTFNITSESGAGCSAGNGLKTVYARFKDAAGNWGVTVMDDITYDASTPDIVAVTAGADSTNRNTLPTNTWFDLLDTGSDSLLSYAWTNAASTSGNNYYYIPNTIVGNAFTEPGLNGSWSFDEGNLIDADLPNALTLLNNGGSITSDNGRNVFSQSAYTQITSTGFIPVDSSRQYILSGDFKSAGTSNSILYYGLVPYDKDKNFIGSERSLRLGTDGTVTSYSDTQINVYETLSGWNGGGTYDYARSIGFYYDGNTDKLPDYVMYQLAYDTSPTHGAFSTATGNTININFAIPPAVASNIVPGVTVVKNHTFGGTYMYSAASYQSVPSSWATYSATISGEAFNNTGSTFRPGTKYVQLMMLANYAQGAEAVIHYDNLKFKEINGTAFDLSTGAHNGTLYNGPTFDLGRLGKALSFDGTDDYLESSQGATANAYTFMMWLNPQSSAIRRLFFHQGANDCSQYLELRSDNKILNVHGESPYTYVVTDGTAPDNTWTHYAVTWDGTTMKAYINGAPDPGAQVGSAAFTTGGTTKIGSSCNVYFYKGLMDEVKTYSRALSATEIANEYAKRSSLSAYIDNVTVPTGISYMHVKPITGAGTLGTERQYIAKYDNTAPTLPALTYTDGYNTTGEQAITFLSTDSESGIAGYTLHYKTATLSGGACTSWSGWSDISSATSPYTHTMLNNTCYQYYVTATNAAGSSTDSTQTPTAVTKVTTSAPTITSCTVSEGTNPQYQYQTGTTIFYNSGYTGAFSVNISASDPGSGIMKVSFPSLGTGFSPGFTEDTSVPYSQTYTWDTSATTSPGAQTSTVTSNSGRTSTCGFTVTKDATAPSSGSMTYSSQYITSTDTKAALTVNDGTDADSGLDVTSRILQRAAGTLGNGSCSGYGVFENTTYTGTYPNLTDSSTVSNATCYKYQWLVSDLVGNQTIYTSTNEVKYDSSAPTGGSVVINGGASTTNNPVVTLTLSATDSESGLGQMQLSCDTVTWSAAQAYATSATFNLASGAGCASAFGTKTVYARFSNNAGSWSTPVSDQILYDNLASASTSTFDIDPTTINDNGTDTSTATITIRNSSNDLLADKVVRITYTGPTNGIIYSPATINPDPAIYEQMTGSNGQITFTISSTTRGSYTFLATIMDDSIILSDTPALTVQCTSGEQNNQCVEIYIEPGSGELTMTVPSSFTFPAILSASTPQNVFSINDTNYQPNVNDYVTVTDTRASGGFTLQLQSSPFVDTSVTPNLTIPVTPSGQSLLLPSTLHVATKASNTGGQQLNGIEYDTGYIAGNGVPVTAPLNVSGAFNSASTFTSLSNNVLNGVVDLINGSVSSGQGHNGSFRQNVQYYLQIPAFQPPGNYTATLTYDLISS